MESATNIDSDDQMNGESNLPNTRKRPAPSPDLDDDDDMVDRLLPAAAAMKRRRLEEERIGISSERSVGESQSTTKSERVGQPIKEINIKDVVRESCKVEEQAARQEEEDLRETLDGMRVEEMKDLAKIVEMEVPAREPIQRRDPNVHHNDRWNEQWNGRKNFKKFRRRGEGTQSRRGQSVIVPLEEVKKKDQGIGENYWIDDKHQKKKRNERERATQSQTQSQMITTAEESHTVADVPSELALDRDLPETIDIDAPRSTRGQEKTQQAETHSSRSQINNGKRPAISQPSGSLAKKQKKFAVQDSDSDSEDELKFRFKKRNK